MGIKFSCVERGSEVNPLRAAVDLIYELSIVGSRPSEDLWMWEAGRLVV